MANKPHIEILQLGVVEWNGWRRQHQADSPKFRWADLRDANLMDAHLAKADLTSAFLERANLWGADLTKADLSGANLRGANLTDANLTGANLTGANLIWADLRAANLKGAQLRKAVMLGTFLADLDLRGIQGLEAVDHQGPSTIGIDTLFRSAGEIPEVFLRGCGVPEVMIAYAGSLIGNAIEYYSTFISYSHKDQAFAQRLQSRLRDEGIRVWYAPEDIAGGRKLHDQIDTAIKLHDKLLVVLSEHSMASEWVKTEVLKARQREVHEKRQVLFPISLASFEEIKRWEYFDADSGTDLAREIRQYFIPDFSSWKSHDKFERAFARLVSDLRSTRPRRAEG